MAPQPAAGDVQAALTLLPVRHVRRLTEDRARRRFQVAEQGLLQLR
jgi:hypothetical protein